jgi:hypothetical protein
VNVGLTTAHIQRTEILGTSPSGSRTARLSLRVETLISIRFMAQRPSQSSACAAVAVIHFAASIVVRDPLGYYRNNTANSRALIEAAVKGVCGISSSPRPRPSTVILRACRCARMIAPYRPGPTAPPSY